jgi:hypothetical protein
LVRRQLREFAGVHPRLYSRLGSPFSESNCRPAAASASCA